MSTSVWNAKEKNLFRAGMNRWFRREYFVEKSPNVAINKGDWITVTRKYLFQALKFTVKRLLRRADIKVA